ncbi:hypothetical protein QBC46DRAFT_220684, partial [Diplogelasinospora grovesii]
LALAVVPLVAGHFVLQVPTSIGFDDVKEGTAPCGGFDITSRTGVSEWPVAGAPIQIISTHPQAEWEIKAALLNDTFRYLLPKISQQGLGEFCLPSVPGIKEWEGLDGVMQMIQHAVDGALYQCAAIKFVGGAAASVPDSCKNASSIVASFEPGTDTGTLATVSTGMSMTASATTTGAAGGGPANRTATATGAGVGTAA